jgi:hypothetical protein
VTGCISKILGPKAIHEDYAYALRAFESKSIVLARD